MSPPGGDGPASSPAQRKQQLLARNAELRAALGSELAVVRAELAPAARWLGQAQRAAAWARSHAPLLAAAAALAGTLILLRRRAPEPREHPSTSQRLWRVLRLAITIGGLVSRVAARVPRPAK